MKFFVSFLQTRTVLIYCNVLCSDIRLYIIWLSFSLLNFHRSFVYRVLEWLPCSSGSSFSFTPLTAVFTSNCQMDRRFQKVQIFYMIQNVLVFLIREEDSWSLRRLVPLLLLLLLQISKIKFIVELSEFPPHFCWFFPDPEFQDIFSFIHVEESFTETE